ncbi:MAG: 1-acyl-sn-glycerol-3-phosphate acyltransferase [Verrucomicrobiota bacterium]|nr:1-acyl-sn-glycerol-3-phosphate acyltransferase [Verrucomicrobiota bacterium]
MDPFPTRWSWTNDTAAKNWNDLQVVLILNHTSLFEFLFASVVPFGYLWHLSREMVYPAAAETLERPLIGTFLKIVAQVVLLTRKRDNSWIEFLQQMDDQAMTVFLPEGRMKRLTGLDKTGQPMAVKTGVYDLLRKFRPCQAVILYSGGLHHVCPPEKKGSQDL